MHKNKHYDTSNTHYDTNNMHYDTIYYNVSPTSGIIMNDYGWKSNTSTIYIYIILNNWISISHFKHVLFKRKTNLRIIIPCCDLSQSNISYMRIETTLTLNSSTSWIMILKRHTSLCDEHELSYEVMVKLNWSLSNKNILPNTSIYNDNAKDWANQLCNLYGKTR